MTRRLDGREHILLGDERQFDVELVKLPRRSVGARVFVGAYNISGSANAAVLESSAEPQTCTTFDSNGIVERVPGLLDTGDPETVQAARHDFLAEVTVAWEENGRSVEKRLGPRDLILNAPGRRHSFRNDGFDPLWMETNTSTEYWQKGASLLTTDPLYREVKERIDDMNGYLDADALRRQANTVVRLTVVTIFGLIGTVATGFLGMNLIAAADASLGRKLLYFALVFMPVLGLTLYTIVKSKRLSDFLDALSDERLPTKAKLGAFLAVWSERRRG